MWPRSAITYGVNMLVRCPPPGVNRDAVFVMRIACSFKPKSGKIDDAPRGDKQM